MIQLGGILGELLVNTRHAMLQAGKEALKKVYHYLEKQQNVILIKE